MDINDGSQEFYMDDMEFDNFGDSEQSSDTQNYDQPEVNESSNPEKSKPSKKEKAKKSKKQQKQAEQDTEEDKPVRNMLLYIVTDRLIPNLVQFARECGLNVTNAYDRIDDIRDIRMMQYDPARIVIIDSGTGKFVTPTIRKTLIDFIGMNDEDTEITVFYTDSIIKSDTEEEIGKESKHLTWIKYENTISCIANIISHKDEKYIIDKQTSFIVGIDGSNQLALMGNKTPGVDLEALAALTINPVSIQKNIEMESEKLPAFDIKY